LSALIALRPGDEIDRLLEERESVFLELRGVYFARLCKRLDGYDCLEPLKNALSDPDPEWRAFACDALGGVGDDSAVPYLLDRLHDVEPVGTAFRQTPVSLVAANALLKFRRCDGVGQILAYAEASALARPALLRRLGQYTGTDLGGEVGEWREWFARHSPECLGSDTSEESGLQRDD
jgi:hypothetical protein